METFAIPHTPAQAEQSNQAPMPTRPEFKFVLWEHVPENAVEAAKQLADCHVVAIERIGAKDQKQQELYSNAATALLSSEPLSLQNVSPEESTARQILLEDPLLRPLIDVLRRSDKRVVFFDLTQDDKKLYRQAERAEYDRDLLEIAHDKEWPSRKLKKVTLQTASAIAASNVLREERIVPRLRNLARP